MPTSSELIPTAVPGLDYVLGGGLVSRSLVFLVGTPGAGKTIMASQIVFNVARQGMPTLILTAFSEGPVKLLAHLQTLTFFDAALVGEQITILSLPTIIGDKPEQAAAAIVQTIRQYKARIVLIDGFQGVAGLLGTPSIIRQTLADIANLVSFLDVILLVTLEGIARSDTMSSALTTADAVLGLDYGVSGGQHTRYLDVVKQRGAAPVSGLHPYLLTDAGVQVFPRLEATTFATAMEAKSGRIPFGLPELDALLHGGLTRQTSTILAGAPGVGKTTLSLFWALTNARPTAQTLIVTFSDYAARLEQKASAFGLDLRTAQASGAVRILRLSPLEALPDMVATTVLAHLTPDTTQLVLDDLAGLVSPLGARSAAFLTALVMQCYQRGVTSLLLMEIDPLSGLHLPLAGSVLSLTCENVVILQQVVATGQLHRILAVLKMRYSAFDPTLRELVLDEQGVRVLTPAQTAADVLDDAATAGGGFAPDVTT